MSSETGKRNDETRKDKRIVSVGSSFNPYIKFELPSDTILVDLEQIDIGIKATASSAKPFISGGIKRATDYGITMNKEEIINGQYCEFIKRLVNENGGVIRYRFQEELSWLREKIEGVSKLQESVLKDLGDI